MFLACNTQNLLIIPDNEYYDPTYIMLLNMQTTSGLSLLIHGGIFIMVLIHSGISLQDVTSNDNLFV